MLYEIKITTFYDDNIYNIIIYKTITCTWMWLLSKNHIGLTDISIYFFRKELFSTILIDLEQEWINITLIHILKWIYPNFPTINPYLFKFSFVCSLSLLSWSPSWLYTRSYPILFITHGNSIPKTTNIKLANLIQ